MKPITGIQGRIECVVCGYNLHGAKPDGVCPECGTSVATSLRPNRDRVRPMAWVLVAIGITFSVIHGVNVFTSSSGPTMMSVALAMGFVAPLLMIAMMAFLVRGLIATLLLILLTIGFALFDWIILIHASRDAQGALALVFGPAWEWPFVGAAFLLAIGSRLWSSMRKR